MILTEKKFYFSCDNAAVYLPSVYILLIIFSTLLGPIPTHLVGYYQYIYEVFRFFFQL